MSQNYYEVHLLNKPSVFGWIGDAQDWSCCDADFPMYSLKGLQ